MAPRSRNGKTGMADRGSVSQSNVVLVHGFDPRGLKVGGLETYSRDFIRHKPAAVRLWVIGVDAFGDLDIGKWTQLRLDDVEFSFFPVARYPESKMAEAATHVWQSLTAKFVIGIGRHYLKIKQGVPANATFDLRRVETSWLPTMLGRKFIQMLHGEGAPKKPMDSLLSRFPIVHNGMQGFALQHCSAFLCVNPLITERIKSEYPAHAGKVGTLPTWANPKLFQPVAAPSRGPLGVVFCGRLDKFKRPDLMFRVIQRANKLIPEGVRFNLVGASDPSRFEEFDLIRSITTLHGAKDATGVHQVIATSHCGLLTSEFEGLPRFVLECLATGRPVVSSALPQLHGIIINGSNGYLVPLRDEEAFVSQAADALGQIADNAPDWNADTIASTVAEYTPARMLSRVYGYHEALNAEGRIEHLA